MKRIAIAVFLYFVLFHVHAQDRSSKGYVITNELDTLYGSIKEGTDKQLVSDIKFKDDHQSNEIKYTASELAGFGFEYGRTFQSFAIKNDSTFRDEYVFAKRIVDGKISLFSSPIIQQNDQPDFIIINNHTQDTVHITQPEKKTILENGKKYAVNTTTHIRKIESIKGNPINENLPKIRYSESAIRKDIFSFNKEFEFDYPSNVYKPKTSYFNDLSIGLPITGDYSSDEITFRISYFRNSYSHERITSISYMYGISYRYWENTSEISSTIKNGDKNFRRQIISVIPIGFNLHYISRIFIPYIYAGLGIGMLVDTAHQVREFENLGNKSEYSVFFPTINVGIGLKIKLKSNAISFEITPTENDGFFGNVGFSF